MNLGQLEVLVAIVDTGSLTEAAEAVGLTQSAVSYSLSKLEAELGVTLLERGRQGVTVTRIGEDILQHAGSILIQVEIIRQKTSRERGLAVGKLRFGCVPHTARLLTGIIRDFQHQYPDIEIVLFEGNPQELVDWLATQVIDIGTVLNPEDYATAVQLAQDEVKVVVSQAHRLATQAAVSVDALANEPLIGPKAEYWTFSNLLGAHMQLLPRLRYEVSAHNTIMAMVRENMGISMMPDKLVDADTEGLVKLSFDPQLVINVYLAATVQSPAIDAFLTSAAAWAKSHGFLSELA